MSICSDDLPKIWGNGLVQWWLCYFCLMFLYLLRQWVAAMMILCFQRPWGNAMMNLYFRLRQWNCTMIINCFILPRSFVICINSVMAMFLYLSHSLLPFVFICYFLCICPVHRLWYQLEHYLHLQFWAQIHCPWCLF